MLVFGKRTQTALLANAPAVSHVAPPQDRVEMPKKTG
jgi:hypothetical protein